GLVLQLTRFGFLLLLWLFVYAVIRTLRADIATAGGSRLARYTRGDKRDRSARAARGSARYLVVTHGALANTRIT
ncbi:FHA domain-containing protein, partial [Streptomyces sp. SID10244]|nr:FHA domain-containing protein [Streptomyces sp. SID10244]